MSGKIQERLGEFDRQTILEVIIIIIIIMVIFKCYFSGELIALS